MRRMSRGGAGGFGTPERPILGSEWETKVRDSSGSDHRRMGGFLPTPRHSTLALHPLDFLSSRWFDFDTAVHAAPIYATHSSGAHIPQKIELARCADHLAHEDVHWNHTGNSGSAQGEQGVDCGTFLQASTELRGGGEFSIL
jgi:hypothetical protein